MESLATLLLLVMSWTTSRAYPDLFVRNRGCALHPSAPVKRHGAPVADGETRLGVTASGSSPTTYCPGAEHRLQVTFPEARMGLLTTTVGTFQGAAGDCPSRIVWGQDQGRAASQQAVLTVPCTATGPLTLRVSSAAGSSDAFHQTSLTLQADPACAAPSCAGGTSTPNTTRATPPVATAPISPPPAGASGPGGCTPSTLGYTCQQTAGHVTIHWTLGAALPANPCTRGVPSPTHNSTTLHMAVQAATTGYVALGFPEEAGEMVESDAVLGWATSQGAQVNAYHIKNKRVSSRDIVSGWATNMGVYEDSSGVTTVCFSRDLNAASAPVKPQLQATAPVDVIWAVGPRDALEAHTRQGSAILTLNGGSSPPPPGVPNGTANRTVNGTATCPPSSLGYQCTIQSGPATIHYSLGGQPPASDCFRGANARGGDDYLHFAVEAPTAGYVSLAFAEEAGVMFPADAVIGWMESSGRPNVAAYTVRSQTISPSDMVNPSWAVNMGVMERNGVTTICFSRPLTITALGRRKLQQQQMVSSVLDPNVPFRMNYAVGDRDGLGDHSSRGGLTLNVQSGTTTDVVDNVKKDIRLHGILMAVAWVGLLPLGMILARHKWLLQSPLIMGKAVWFWAHVGLQVTGVALFIGGVVIAFVRLDPAKRSLTEVHEILAFVLLALTGLQMLGGPIRPAPDAPRRVYWNWYHWTLGRVAVALGVANVFVGIKIFHDFFGERLAVWVGPVVGVLALYLLIGLVLEAKKSSHDQVTLTLGKPEEKTQMGGAQQVEKPQERVVRGGTL